MLIDPVGILRRHQREVREKLTMAKNVSKTTETAKMKTLDNIWKTFQNDDDDVVMEDSGPKTAEETTNCNKRKQKMKETHANDANDKITKNTTTETLHEFAVRIKIQADDKNTAHKHHRRLMEMIAKEMSELKIYSNTNELLQTTDIAIDHFNYHETGKRTKYFIVVHGVEMNQPYHRIKQNKTIFEFLKSNKCFIHKHSWPEEEWNIVTVGYLSGASPKHQAKTTIKKELNKINGETPKYELGATTIKTEQNGTTYTTFAYEIKCIADDTEDVYNYLLPTGQDTDITLIKHKWKYSNPEVYINGIRKQNETIRDIRTIPLYGITRNEMTHLQDTLRSHANIIDISPTAKTTDQGRWNIYTKTTNFASTTTWLTDNIKQIYNEHCKDIVSDQDTPNHFTPEIRFNSTISFRPQNKDPHLDSASTSLSKYSGSHANSWASVVSGYNRYSDTSKPTAVDGYSGYSITKPTSEATRSISSLNEISKTLQTINLTIQNICKRLDNIEERLAEQEKDSQNFHTFETETRTNMEKLTNILLKLKERTIHIPPRRLDNAFEMMESNKRQDTRCSPSKALQRE